MDNFGFANDSEQHTTDIKIVSQLSSNPENVHSFEEAIELVETGKFHYFLLFICGLCHMVNVIESVGISVSLPFLKCDLTPSIAEQNMLTSACFLGNVISFYPIGFFTDTWGRLKILRTTLVLSFITSAISAFSINIWMLIVFRFLNGLTTSGCQTSTLSFFGEFHGRKTQMRYVTLVCMFFSIGLLFVPGLAIGILPLHIDATIFGLKFTPWRLLILTNSSISLLALLGLLMLPESPKFTLTQKKKEEAMRTLRKIFRLNTGRPESEYPVDQVHIEILSSDFSSVHGVKDACMLIWTQTAPLFHKERALLTINLSYYNFCTNILGGGMFLWLPTILNQLATTSVHGYMICESFYASGEVAENGTSLVDTCTNNLDIKMFEILIGVSAMLVSIDFILAITVKMVGKRCLLICLLFVSAVGFLAAHWVSSYNLSAAMLALTVAMNCCLSILNTIAVEAYPTNINGMAICLTMLIGRLGVITGENLIGFFIFTYCDTLLYVFLGIIATLAILTFFLPDKKLKTKPTDIIEGKRDWPDL